MKTCLYVPNPIFVCLFDILLATTVKDMGQAVRKDLHVLLSTLKQLLLAVVALNLHDQVGQQGMEREARWRLSLPLSS